MQATTGEQREGDRKREKKKQEGRENISFSSIFIPGDTDPPSPHCNKRRVMESERGRVRERENCLSIFAPFGSSDRS